MTFLSSFELLFEQIIPQKSKIKNDIVSPGLINPTGTPDPLVIQSFFVLISNIGRNTVDLQLKFTASNKYNLKLGTTFAVFDIDNQDFQALGSFAVPDINPPNTDSVLFPLSIESGVTGVFLLQPNISALLGGSVTVPFNTEKINFGIRGYVEISVSPVTSSGAKLLISPQTRGTFLDPKTGNVLSEEAYPLPTTSSTNQFSF